MARRDLKKDLQFMEMLLDDNDKIKDDVIIECSCGSRDFKISSCGGTILECKECEFHIDVSFIYNFKCKYIKDIETHVCEGDIVENEAFRDIVVLRNDVLTTESNASDQPVENHKGLKVIGNIRDNPKMVEELKVKQKEIEEPLISQELIDATKRMEEADRNIAERKEKEARKSFVEGITRHMV